MGWWEAVVLGLVQGLTEFLPISSSAHQRVVGELLSGGVDPGAAFTAITQIGTETAVLVYFRHDIARIVAAHRDMTPPDGPLTEREIVYLADKLVACHFPVNIRARFQAKIDQWPGRADIQADIATRRDNALAMAERFGAEAGRSLEETLDAAGMRLAPTVPDEARGPRR